MPSSSDYTLAKKIINIQQNLDFIADLNSKPSYNNAFSTVIGNDLTPCGGQCIGDQGPPGEPGDKYLTTFTDTLYKYIMDTGSIGIQVETGLAYINGHNIRCVNDGLNPPYDSFTATVMSYNKGTGVMILNAISNLSEGFTYSTRRTYKVNIDYYYHNPQSNFKIPVLNDNNSDSPCYINFIKQPGGEVTNLNISNNIFLKSLNGELYTNSLFETTNTSSRMNITPMDEYYSVDFIRTLQPKKYYTVKKPSLERYGFITQDITNAYDNLGLVDSSGICYSDIIAPVVSVLQTVLNRLDSIEDRLMSLENNHMVLSNNTQSLLASDVPFSASLTQPDSNINNSSTQTIDNTIIDSENVSNEPLSNINSTSQPDSSSTFINLINIAMQNYNNT
jgi:hypothetical protein